VTVRVKAFGHLREIFGSHEQRVELSQGATLAALLVAIEDSFGDRLPASLWNRREHRFRGPVVLSVGGRIVRGRDTVLADGEEIGIHQALVGG
jgi:molybdopterin converting factor small subunit